MKRIPSPAMLLFTFGAGVAALGCSGSGEDSVETRTGTESLVTRPAARLILSDALLQRLKQRALAGDSSWAELEQRCDEYASGTMHPPGGEAYPDHPHVGQGYQGEEYLPAIRSLGLCYRTVAGVDAAAEARYADAGSRLLEAMSTPVGSGGQSPSTDSGYGIRNYGVGMALGYDWLYPALSSALKTRVHSALNAWIDWYDQSGFIKDDPIGNYFAGYFYAKVAASLATEGENAAAPTYWNDVVSRMWGQLVKPQFQSRMRGGGWPEGWGYGKKAVLNFAEAAWAVKTATGLDWLTEIPLARDQAQYVTHFAWPSFKHMDDQGTIRSGTNLRASAELASGLATVLEATADPYAASMRGLAGAVVTAAGDDREAWAKFMYGDSGMAAASHTAQRPSYFAEGPGHVGLRSSWDTGAIWGALSGGPYINASYSGEQLFGAGGLSIVVGDQPLLINPTGWLPQNAGTAGENFVYDDSFGTRQRRLYNTFFVDDGSNPYSPGQNNYGPDESKAHVERFEDGGGFVRARAANLEDQYGWHDGSRPVTQFTRDMVYLRPGTFVLLDRTAITQGGADQWISFHTPVAAVQVPTADPTQRRFDVGTLGSIRSLLPANASTTSTGLPAGASRLEVHPAARAASQTWLTVISATSTVLEQVRLSAADGNVTSGDLVGVHVQGAREQVVLFPGDHAGAVQTGAAEYRVRHLADADHVLLDVAPSSSGYAVTTTASGDQLLIRVAPGGSHQPSANGTLSFSVGTAGAVSGAPAPASPPIPSVSGRKLFGPLSAAARQSAADIDQGALELLRKP